MRLHILRVLNHAEGGITKIHNRYAADREKREALEQWGRHLTALVEGQEGAEVVELRR